MPKLQRVINALEAQKPSDEPSLAQTLDANKESMLVAINQIGSVVEGLQSQLTVLKGALDSLPIPRDYTESFTSLEQKIQSVESVVTSIEMPELVVEQQEVDLSPILSALPEPKEVDLAEVMSRLDAIEKRFDTPQEMKVVRTRAGAIDKVIVSRGT